MTNQNIEKSAAVRKDRMRFSKNKLSSNLTYLAIVVNVLYFVSIYKTNVQNYYSVMIGLSVVYNLMFMLFCFLSAEGIKNYKFSYGIVLVVIGALQLLRIVYFPLQGHSTTYMYGESELLVMQDDQFVRTVIYLIVSAALLIAAGIVGMVRSKVLANYQASLEGEAE